MRIFSFKNFPIEQSKHYLAIYDGMSRKSNIELVHIFNLVSGDWLVYRCAIWQRVLWSDHPILAAPPPGGGKGMKNCIVCIRVILVDIVTEGAASQTICVQ